MRFLLNKNFFLKGQNFFLTVAAIAVFIAFFVMTVWGQGGLFDLYSLHTQRQALIENNRNLRFTNLTRLNEIERLKSLKYLEQTAREDLGMIRQNETVYVVK